MPRAGNSTARGYGHAHQQLRKRWQQVIDTTGHPCSRCTALILPGTPWDLDHTDDRTGYAGPAHRSCNRAAGARKTNAKRTGQRRTSVRW